MTFGYVQIDGGCFKEHRALRGSKGWNETRRIDFQKLRGSILALERVDNFDLKNPYDARFYGNGLVIADSHHGRVLFINTSESQ